MSMLPIKNTRLPGVKPVGRVEIDWSHPLARGLTDGWVFQDSLSSIKNQWLSSTDYTIGVVSDNIAVTQDSAAGNFSGATISGSVYAVVWDFTVANQQLTTTTSGSLNLTIGGFSIRLGVYTSFITGETITAATSGRSGIGEIFQVGDRVKLVAFYDGVKYAFAVNGKIIPNLSSTSEAGLGNGGVVSADWHNTLSSFKPKTHGIFVFTGGKVNQEQARLLSDNPYAFLKSPNDQTFLFTEAAAPPGPLDVVQFNFWNIGSTISTPWFNSSPTLGAIYAYLGTGGSVSVGLAALNYSAFYLGIGGGKGTGQALIEYIASYVANGGSFSTGQVLYNLIAETLSQGGSYSTGAVTTSGNFAIEGAGGAASTGQTTFNVESYLTADGGSASSGQAEYNYDVKLYGIGGSASSGVSGRNIIAEISSVGGSASTGSSTIGTVFYSEGQGGATSSGQPDYSISIVPEGQGGSASSGASTLNINLSYEALGGAASLGSGDYQFLAAAVGFIVQQKPFSAIIEKTGAKEIIVEAKGIQNFIIEKK